MAGRFLAEALGGTLARLWPTIDAFGPLADIILQAAAVAANSAGLPLAASDQWAPPYDSVIVLGQAGAQDVGPVVRIGADGWMVYFGAAARLVNFPNTIGPAAGAAIAAAEVFKQVFATQLVSHDVTPLGDGQWNLWTLGTGDELPREQSIILPRTHVFGCGAVTHGLLLVLERWPVHVASTVLLIDHDAYDQGNGQRYPGMQPDDVFKPKVEALAERLRVAHPELVAHPYQRGMNHYFDEYEPMPSVEFAIVGLDSAESRRHAALKLPRRSINMWTENHHLGSSRHGIGDGWPCLFCSYPEKISDQRDEVAIVSSQTGLPPNRVRDLFDNGGDLTEKDVTVIGPRLGRKVNDLVHMPLRTVLQQMCATGHIKLPGATENSDVPFAFSSLLAGVIGFRNVIRELWCPSDSPTRWTYDVLHRPTDALVQSVAARSGCFLCGTGNLGANS